MTTPLPTLSDAIGIIEKFAGMLAPEVGQALLRGVVDLESSLFSPVTNWKVKIPCADRPGVYFLLDAVGREPKQNRILYIGKSEGLMGTRICEHLKAPSGGGVCSVFAYPRWQSQARELGVAMPIVRLLSLSPPQSNAAASQQEETWFFAPAIESLLIHRLKPPFNNVGK